MEASQKDTGNGSTSDEDEESEPRPVLESRMHHLRLSGWFRASTSDLHEGKHER